MLLSRFIPPSPSLAVSLSLFSLPICLANRSANHFFFFFGMIIVISILRTCRESVFRCIADDQFGVQPQKHHQAFSFLFHSSPVAAAPLPASFFLRTLFSLRSKGPLEALQCQQPACGRGQALPYLCWTAVLPGSLFLK